jgi:hypothetical protein
MSSALLVCVLEIDKGAEPRWAATRVVLAAMSDEEVTLAYLRAPIC